jgi:tetratricopeptide (TPR) repeat protein
VGSGEVKDRVEKGSIWKGVAAILGAVALLLSLYWGFSTPDSYDDLALDLSPKEQLDTKVYRGEVEQNGIMQNGAEQDTDPILLEVQALVAADEYGLAIELINELLGNETRAAVLSFWTRIDLEVAKGMYTYNLGDKDEALEVFLEVEQKLDKVEADSMQSEGLSLTRLAEKRDNVYWVIAQSYYAMNEPALAVNYFEKIVALDGSYSRAAANYIQALKAD